MKWLQDNAVSILFGVTGSIGVIESFFNGLLEVIAVNPRIFSLWSISIVALFTVLACLLHGRWVKRKLGMSVTEAVESMKETDMDTLEETFLSMPFPSQHICQEAIELDEVKTYDSMDDETPNYYRTKARDAGFVRLEMCPNGGVRTVPTKQLEKLFEDRPTVRTKVWEGVIAETTGLDVHHSDLIEDYPGVIIKPDTVRNGTMISGCASSSEADKAR